MAIWVSSLMVWCKVVRALFVAISWFMCFNIWNNAFSPGELSSGISGSAGAGGGTKPAPAPGGVKPTPGPELPPAGPVPGAPPGLPPVGPVPGPGGMPPEG
eukprot:7403584-Pyramimonas_sp.AAC.1